MHVPRALRPSWSQPAVALALFAGAPAWGYRVEVMCKPGDCPAFLWMPASLLSAWGRWGELRPSLATFGWALLCLALAWALVAAAREVPWRDVREAMRPSRASLALAAPGWATLPFVLAQFLVFTRRLEWMGRAQFLVLSATKVLAFLVLPLTLVQDLLVDAILLFANAWLAWARLDAGTRLGSGSHPAFLTPLSASIVLAVSALLWYVLAALAVHAWRARRARRA